MRAVLIVYGGALAVFFMFVLMLLASPKAEVSSRNRLDMPSWSALALSWTWSWADLAQSSVTPLGSLAGCAESAEVSLLGLALFGADTALTGLWSSSP